MSFWFKKHTMQGTGRLGRSLYRCVCWAKYLRRVCLEKGGGLAGAGMWLPVQETYDAGHRALGENYLQVSEYCWC